MARPAIYTVDCDEPMYLEDLEASKISNYNFERCLELYNDHVPPWYRSADVQRFEIIPRELEKRSSLFLGKQELLELNRWLQYVELVSLRRLQEQILINQFVKKTRSTPPR